MKKWIKKSLSNKYIRVSIINLLIMMLIAFFGPVLLLLVGPGMSGDSLSALNDVIIILITIPAIIGMGSLIIMGWRIITSGKEVKHDKKYWEDTLSVQENADYEKKNDPYLLKVRHNNPILTFGVGVCCFLLVPYLIYTHYFNYTFSKFAHIVIFLLIEYVLIVIMVIFIRTFRRLRAFRVKKHSKGE